jgi:hypothetical protein
LLAGTGRAQTSASIAGTVHDTSGALVPGATVVVINEASKAEWDTTSNGTGFFSVSALPPATYSLRVSAQGFETWSVTGIVAHPGDSLTVPKIALKVGKTEISITVSAETAGVTLNSPEHSTLITSDDINRLSTIGRDADELLSILPGFTINAGADLQNDGPGGSIYSYQVVGPGSGALSGWGAGGAAPQQGLVNLKADGANLIDPGDMGGQMSNVNMDQVQEVKVSTSNFGADQSKGPIVIDAVGKAGSTQFHGGVYAYFRNTALNSNDWLSKYYGLARPAFRFAYPGATLGGPVMIPHTNFNAQKKLVFWVGFEGYRQLSPEATSTAFVPSPAMLTGDLSSSTIAAALGTGSGITGTDLSTNCPADWNVTALYNAIGGICYSPDGKIDVKNNTITGGQMPYIDAATTTISSLWPKANRVAQPVYSGGSELYATDGINFAKDVASTNNGFQFHNTEDYSITGTLKLHAAYNWERVNAEAQMNNVYYNPGGTVPYPTPLYSNGHNQYLTLDLTKSVGSSLTNELVGTGLFYFQPAQFANPAKAQTNGTSWASAQYSGGYWHLNETQLPEIVQYETTGIPSLSFGYVPPASQFLRKFSWNVADNLTKVYKTHTIKTGYYMEQTGNNNVTLGSKVNGQIAFMRWDQCYINENTAGSSAPAETTVGNTVGNFLMGCPSGYAQDNSDPIQNLRFRTFEWYATDEWKVNNKLTLTIGIRFAHTLPWYDPHGVGIAVWNPTGVEQHVLYADSAKNTTWPGIDWHKHNSQFANSGYPSRALFYLPRVGFAYDLKGDGKTVVRGGWGMYVSHDPSNVAGGEATATGLQTFTNVSTYGCSFGQLFKGNYSNPYVPTSNTVVGCDYYSAAPTSITPFSVMAADPHDNHMPITYNYNLTIDRQGPWRTAFELAYVGNRTQHLMTLTGSNDADLENQNVIPLGAYFAPDPITNSLNSPNNIPNSADYRPYPNYQQVNVPNHIVWANYNSLQGSWNKQTGALVYGINYTWSKAMGVRGNYDTGSNADPVNPRHDYGVVSFDRPQAINFTYSYQERIKFHGNRILGQALNNWEISGVTSLQSGPDLAVANNTGNYNLGGGVSYYVGTTPVQANVNAAEWLGTPDYMLQPTVTCNPNKSLKKNYFINGSCFGLPAPGTQGWWNLPDSHGPAYFKSDLSIYKDFKINERQTMQLRGSGFNFLNHPLTSFNSQNLSTMYLTAGDPSGSNYTTLTQALENATITNANTFGSTAFKNGVRIVELAFKYNF